MNYTLFSRNSSQTTCLKICSKTYNLKENLYFLFITFVGNQKKL